MMLYESGWSPAKWCPTTDHFRLLWHSSALVEGWSFEFEMIKTPLCRSKRVPQVMRFVGYIYILNGIRGLHISNWNAGFQSAY